MQQATPSVRELFIAAVGLEGPAARSAFLDRHCCDAELRRRIEDMLAVDAQGSDFLESPAAMAAVTTAPDPRSVVEEPGTVIGPYKLLEPIGEGGMGTVFMAEQAEPVRRRVALKVIKPGMDSKQVVARFEAERQALAMMDHPNIARVIDGGMTPSGRPYFVMELVRGLPITEYCDAEKLPFPERLDLFVLACRAVQHAHQKGIIHRDIKPSNILVTVIDGVAVPKVIDFGVAKATGQALTEKTLFTGLHQFVGTPLYVSPEQAELSGADVDTRSDIYSLGVLLYELLTGTTPFDAETLRRAAFDEMQRLLRERDPEKPSTRLGALGETLTTVSTNRRADSRRLGRAVRGELDWIAMKALEKDRTRRYETAKDLAADVMRHLTGRPVEAGPPSAWYRLAKSARRHRAALTTATLVGLALVAGAGVSLWQAGVARKAQRHAEAAERKAVTEAAIARAVNEFLQDDLLGQAPGLSQLDQQRNPYLTVAEALDRASARIGQRFRDQPLVEAAIRTTIGISYNYVYKHMSAVPHLERAVALRTAHLGSVHPDTLVSMRGLAYAYQLTGRGPETIALESRILEVRTASLGPDHPETLSCVGTLAQAYEFSGQWDVSNKLWEDLLERLSTTYGPTHSLTLDTMHNLALNCNRGDRLAESMALHEQLLELLEVKYGNEHESTFWPMETFGIVCSRAGDLGRADQLLRKAVELRRTRDPLGRGDRLANALGFLAVNQISRREYAAAEASAREAVAIFEKLRPYDQRHFYWVSVLGESLLGQQRFAEAEPLLLKGFQGMKQQEAFLLPMERRRMATACLRFVRFYEVTQQLEQASAWREVLSTLPPPDCVVLGGAHSPALRSPAPGSPDPRFPPRGRRQR